MPSNKYMIADHVGKRVGSRTILAQVAPDHGKVWRCRCDCGSIDDVRASLLMRGRADHCVRCTPQRQRGEKSKGWRGHGAIPGTAYRNFVAQAERRGIEWALTIEYLADLFEKQNGRCALTGWPLVFFRGATHGRGDASVDRIDSAKGYVPGNVWIVHKDVNFAKQSLSAGEFIEMCRAVARTAQPGWLAFGDEVGKF